jgi:lysophospholipase L1-like esterase
VSRSPRRSLFALLALTLGVAGALFAAEVGLRMLRFEFALHPTAVQFGWPDPVTIEERYRLDRDLLWVPKDYHERVREWTGRSPTIAHMGDSCTEFGRYDDYLAELVREHATNSARDSYAFVNLGVGGWSSYQGLAQMRRDVVMMRPAIVTINYGWNDHWRSYGLPDREIGEFVHEQPAWMQLSARLRVTQLVTKARFARHRRAAELRSDTPERVSLPDFAANLTAMVSVAREHGIIPVLLTAPTSHEVGAEPEYLAPRWLHDLDRLVPLHREYAAAVREVSRAHDVVLIDLHAAFDAMPGAERAGYFNEDGIHLNERGNAKVAEIMFEHFVHHGLVKR